MTVYLNAWLIGEQTEGILDDLIAPGGHPPARVWLPLDCTHDGPATAGPEFRSGYGFRESDGEQWVDFAVPPAVVREWLGPKAMVHPKRLAQGKALRSNVEVRDGILMAKVPRYFATFGTAWTFEHAGWDPLITRDGTETNQTTVGDLDFYRSFHIYSREPLVIIDEGGPRRFERRRDAYYNVAGMTDSEEVLEAIAGRPSDTPVRCAWCTF